MAPWTSEFDESRLDDEQALAVADAQLRGLAESGARQRRAVLESAEDAAVALTRSLEVDRPRAVVLHGPEAGLLRAVLAGSAGVPVVVADGAELPGWVGGMDLVVVLAPAGAPDAVAAGLAAAAVRRGCQVLAVCGPGSPVADHAAGRWSAVLRTEVSEPLVAAVVALAHLGAVRLAPALDPDDVAAAMDDVAVACSPYRDAGANPAKLAATALGETVPLVTPRLASPYGLRAVEGAALSLRRLTGLPVLAGAAEAVRPVLEAVRSRSVFDDPYDAPAAAPPPSLLLVGDVAAPVDGHAPPDGPDAVDLRALAEARGVRVVQLDAPAAAPAPPLAAHAAVVLHAAYAAAYLRLATVDAPR